MLHNFSSLDEYLFTDRQPLCIFSSGSPQMDQKSQTKFFVSEICLAPLGIDHTFALGMQAAGFKVTTELRRDIGQRLLKGHKCFLCSKVVLFFDSTYAWLLRISHFQSCDEINFEGFCLSFQHFPGCLGTWSCLLHLFIYLCMFSFKNKGKFISTKYEQYKSSMVYDEIS